jgi:hypothetical protein
MLYVIKNLDNGKYVARQGLQHSYTTKLSEVRFFINNEDARRGSAAATRSSKNCARTEGPDRCTSTSSLA